MRKILSGIFALALFGGCADMPEIADDARVKEPRPISVYTILEDAAMPPTLYLRSDYPSVAGVKVNDRVERYGRRSAEHQIDITRWLNWDNRQVGEYTLLIDDYSKEKFYYHVPETDAPVTLGFLGGGRDQAARLTVAAAQINGFNPDAVIITGGATPLDRRLQSWDQTFFSPIKEMSRRTPLIFLPEDRRLMPTESAVDLPRPYWGRDVGCVRLLFMEMDALKTPATRQAALDWLARDLETSTARWKVLCLAQPVFGAREINARLVETFGSLLEAGKVDLIVSGGGDYYLRTLPIKSGGRSIRYVVTGGLTIEPKKLLGREYAAEMFREPHLGVITADAQKLTWSAYPLTGNLRASPLDSLVITADGDDAGEPEIEKVDILTDALAALTLKHEVLTLAREAARAVPNPQANEQTLNIAMHNPTGQEIHGILRWQAAQDTAWKIAPEAVEFQLQPGYRGTAQFVAKRYINVDTAPMPELTAAIAGVGSANQPLILAAKKAKDVYLRTDNSPINIDGVMTEKVWEDAAQFVDFTALGGGAPRHKFEARLLYDREGIFILTRAELGGVPAITANVRDEAVHRDESVEFFFDTFGEGRDFYQFAVNTRGVQLDRSSQLGLAWNPQWTAKVSVHADYYTVEAFIPFAALGLTRPPSPETRWGFNICRNDFISDGREAAIDTGKSVAGGSRSGAVTGANIAAAAVQDLGAAALRRDAENVARDLGEIAQWADTFGDNARSGCYGDLIFSGGEK